MQSPLPRKKKNLQISAKSRKKNYKIYHISKTKNRTKKVTRAKKWALEQFQFTLSNLATFEESWIFRRSKHPFWMAQTRYEISRTLFFLRHCASVMSRLQLLRGEDGGSVYPKLGNNPNFNDVYKNGDNYVF